MSMFEIGSTWVMHWCRLHWMIFFIDGIALDNIKLLWRNTRAQWTNPPKWHVDMTCTQVILEPFFYLWRFGKFLISPQACIRVSLLTTYGRVVNFENWFDSWTFSELTLVCHEHETMKELYYYEFMYISNSMKMHLSSNVPNSPK
jgi:hypothetical protein